MGKLIRYDYTFRGGLAWRQDGNGNVAKYQYDPLNRLVSVTDSNDVPLVEMDYDVLGNVTHVASTNSVFDYTYDALNRATQAVCLLTNIPGFATVKYKIAYQFDPVGNVTNRVITGLQGLADTITTRYQYDVMNRLTNVVQLTNGTTSASAWYRYDTAGRLWQKGYGNNDVVTHGYDAESRLLSLGITNNTTPVWWSRYQWDTGGNILAITNNNTNVTLYAYDRARQLTNEVVLTNGLAGGETNAWVYDEAGNWLNAPSGNQWLYNADNEMVARAPTGTPTVPSPTSFTLTGEVEPGPQSNKWFNTWAECRGVQGQVSTTDGTFTLPGISIDQWGYNYLDVTVRDVSGNTAQQRRTVVKGVTNALETFHYDGNGNLTNWVNGATNWVYEWDWADRLTKATSNGITVLENWYDVTSRRIAKKELVAGQTKYALYVWEGWASAAVLNQSAQIFETYSRGAGLAGDIGTLVAVTHHAGSTANGTFYIHANHRGDIVFARSTTATLGGHAYGAFGTLKIQAGMDDVCRFMFSSKERDASTGFSYYGFRFYTPEWQRWPNADPIQEKGGYNLYAFVRNNPLNRLDSFGLYCGPGSGIGDILVPDSIPGVFDFGECCYQHDRCYESLGADRLDCDNQWRDCMLDTCHSNCCETFADLYYTMVRAFGQGAFDRAQRYPFTPYPPN